MRFCEIRIRLLEQGGVEVITDDQRMLYSCPLMTFSVWEVVAALLHYWVKKDSDDDLKEKLREIVESIP